MTTRGSRTFRWLRGSLRTLINWRSRRSRSTTRKRKSRNVVAVRTVRWAKYGLDGAPSTCHVDEEVRAKVIPVLAACGLADSEAHCDIGRQTASASGMRGRTFATRRGRVQPSGAGGVGLLSPISCRTVVLNASAGVAASAAPTSAAASSDRNDRPAGPRRPAATAAGSCCWPSRRSTSSQPRPPMNGGYSRSSIAATSLSSWLIAQPPQRPFGSSRALNEAMRRPSRKRRRGSPQSLRSRGQRSSEETTQAVAAPATRGSDAAGLRRRLTRDPAPQARKRKSPTETCDRGRSSAPRSSRIPTPTPRAERHPGTKHGREVRGRSRLEPHPARRQRPRARRSRPDEIDLAARGRSAQSTRLQARPAVPLLGSHEYGASTKTFSLERSRLTIERRSDHSPGRLTCP